MKRIRVAAAALICALSLSSVRANETDQFTVPDDGKPFVDLGPYMTEMHYRVLKRVVDKANANIDKSLRVKNQAMREGQLNRWHSPAYLADSVRAQWGPGFFDMHDLEGVLKSGKAKRNFPDQHTCYRATNWIYFYTHLPIDPRKIVLMFPSSTMKVYGTYTGTDKFGHFHDLGHIYYKSYLGRRAGGQDEATAVAGVVKTFSKGVISEGAIIGTLATGVFSNADLASNYAGMKFYRNLTERVKVEGQWVEPMIVREGEHWRLNDHVRPNSDFFAAFVSDHWNEALNLCVYELGMRGPIRGRLEEMAPKILAFYADEQGRPHDRAWFEQYAKELSTHWGEDYGYDIKDGDAMVTIANTCFKEPGVMAEAAKKAQAWRAMQADRFAAKSAQPVYAMPRHSTANRATTPVRTATAAKPQPQAPAADNVMTPAVDWPHRVEGMNKDTPAAPPPEAKQSEKPKRKEGLHTLSSIAP
jgi:hypothetical protein